MFISRKKKIILDFKKGSFGTVKLAVSRLEGYDRAEGIKMCAESFLNDTFDDFRNKVKIGDGAVVGKLITL